MFETEQESTRRQNQVYKRSSTLNHRLTLRTAKQRITDDPSTASDEWPSSANRGERRQATLWQHWAR